MKKIDHIEFSDGGTEIVTYSGCPLSEEEMVNTGNWIKQDSDIIPVCKGICNIMGESHKLTCPNYLKVIYTSTKGMIVLCAALEN